MYKTADMKAYAKAYRIANKAKIKAYKETRQESHRLYMQEYYTANKEQMLIDNKEYYQNHKLAKQEYARKQGRIYRANNPAKQVAKMAKYRATKLQRTPAWLTKAQWAEIEEFYILTKELQWLSDHTDPLEVDHIVPLKGKTVSGLHVPWNLQILTRSFNARKRNKLEKVG